MKNVYLSALLALNLTACGHDSSFENVDFLTLLTAAVPIAAVVGIVNVDDPKVQAPPAPIPMMMDTTSPTTTITSMVNNDDTITWTVTFNEDLAADPAMRHFSLTGGGSLAMPTTSGRTTTIISTHTSDDEVMLMFDADGGSGAAVADAAGNNAEDETSTAVTPIGQVGLLENLPTNFPTTRGHARSTVSETGSDFRQFQRSADANKFIVEIITNTDGTCETTPPTNATCYTFFTGTNVSDDMEFPYAINEDNTLIYSPFSIGDNAMLHALYTGTGLDSTGAGTTVTAIDIVQSGNRYDLATDTLASTGSVTYTGKYIVVTGNPAAGAAFDSTTLTGTIEFTFNFSGTNSHIANGGMAMDSDGTTQTGRFDRPIDDAATGTTTFEGMAGTNLAGFSYQVNFTADSIGGLYGPSTATTINTTDVTDIVHIAEGTANSNNYIMAIHATPGSN